MKLIDKLKEALELGRNNRLKIRGEISGTNHAEVNIKHIRNESISWNTSLQDVTFGMQSLTSGSIYSKQNYRIDNNHGFIHEHISGSMAVAPVHAMTVSGAITLGFSRLDDRKN